MDGHVALASGTITASASTTPEFLTLNQTAARVRPPRPTWNDDDDGSSSFASRDEQMAPRRGAEQTALAHRAGGLALEEPRVPSAQPDGCSCVVRGRHGTTTTAAARATSK